METDLTQEQIENKLKEMENSLFLDKNEFFVVSFII